MKRVLLILLVCVIGVLGAQKLEFTAPWYLNSFYDYYSDNYVGTKAAGRGYTGTSVMGNIDNVFLNPAAFKTDSFHVYYEMNAKMPADEINSNAPGDLTSPGALGMVGISSQIMENLNVGFSYSILKSIQYDRIRVELMQAPGNYTFRDPKFVDKVLTLSTSYQWNCFSFGLNVMNHIYDFEDYVIYGSAPFALNDFRESVVRFQPGVYWSNKKFAAGVSFTPSTSYDFETDFLTYDTTLPTVVNGGISVTLNKLLLALDVSHEFCSQMDDAFDDRLNIRTGLEYKVKQYAYRVGFIHRPAVWKGRFEVPEYIAPGDESEVFEYTLDEIFQFEEGLVEETEQNMITLGVGWGNDFFGVDGALVQDVTGNVQNTQLHASIYMNLDPIFKIVLHDRAK